MQQIKKKLRNQLLKHDYKEALLTDKISLKLKIFYIGSLDLAVCSEKVMEESMSFGDYDTLTVYYLLLKKSLFPNNLHA